MKVGDFVDVHFDFGCLVGVLISDEGDTVTVSFDNGICDGIPKEKCTLLLSMNKSEYIQ